MRDAGILDGDVVILTHDNSKLKNMDIVAALVDDGISSETTLKYWEKKNGAIQLVPANPAYAPIPIDAGLHVQVQGRLVGLYRAYP